jgi:hypothetical protein
LKGYPRGRAQPSELRTHTDSLEVRWPVKNLPRFRKTRERDCLSTLNRKPNKQGERSTPAPGCRALTQPWPPVSPTVANMTGARDFDCSTLIRSMSSGEMGRGFERRETLATRWHSARFSMPEAAWLRCVRGPRFWPQACFGRNPRLGFPNHRAPDTRAGGVATEMESPSSSNQRRFCCTGASVKDNQRCPPCSGMSKPT